jgi:hypothetical protein
MTEQPATKPNLVLQARNAAVADLIAAHENEFHDFMAKRSSDLGIEYVRPLTPEEQARADVEATLAKYPNLRKEFGAPADPPIPGT